jgi:hypothetical protein
VPGGHFLAEGVLHGAQATVEGYVHGGTPTILGVVDSVLQPGTGSFLRFDYPSRLPSQLQERLQRTAAAAALALGLEETLFNVEMTADPATGRTGIIEVNVRMCGQFADLHQKVDGTSTYEIALDLARGRTPRFSTGGGAWAAAASVPLRVFAACRVERVPPPETVSRLEAAPGDPLVWLECGEGDRLEDFESLDDGHSARYGVINVGGSDAEDAARRAAGIAAELDVRFGSPRQRTLPRRLRVG